jgi:hypothetical protein
MNVAGAYDDAYSQYNPGSPTFDPHAGAKPPPEAAVDMRAADAERLRVERWMAVKLAAGVTIFGLLVGWLLSPKKSTEGQSS